MIRCTHDAGNYGILLRTAFVRLRLVFGVVVMRMRLLRVMMLVLFTIFGRLVIILGRRFFLTCCIFVVIGSYCRLVLLSALLLLFLVWLLFLDGSASNIGAICGTCHVASRLRLSCVR